MSDLDTLVGGLDDTPHVGRGRAAIRAAEAMGYDVDDAIFALSELSDIQRADYDDLDDYRWERSEAWLTFLRALSDCERE